MLTCPSGYSRFLQQIEFWPKDFIAITYRWRCRTELGGWESLVIVRHSLESAVRNAGARSDLPFRSKEKYIRVQVSASQIALADCTKFVLTLSFFLFRFICSNTIEERIKALQERKLAIAHNVLSGERSKEIAKLTLNDLKSLFGL